MPEVFYGVVDVAGFLPMLLSLWIDGSQYFLVVRVLRVLRVFRVLRMVRYVGEAELITQALYKSAQNYRLHLFCYGADGGVRLADVSSGG